MLVTKLFGGAPHAGLIEPQDDRWRLFVGKAIGLFDHDAGSEDNPVDPGLESLVDDRSRVFETLNRSHLHAMIKGKAKRTPGFSGK